jgi:alkanesulfonate monooxygenase SsuD/methylene tetrahydromethanopterin reductase-like flavin-dependent oxidoreductase (luciferase family)
MVARAADTLGYDGLLVPSGRWCDDPWVCSTAIAPTTRRIDYLLARRPGLISPVIAARMVSALDRLTGGRVRILSHRGAAVPGAAAPEQAGSAAPAGAALDPGVRRSGQALAHGLTACDARRECV